MMNEFNELARRIEQLLYRRGHTTVGRGIVITMLREIFGAGSRLTRKKAELIEAVKNGAVDPIMVGSHETGSIEWSAHI